MKLLFTTLFISITTICSAQDYYKAIGMRTGISSGFTYKQFITQTDAFETILSLKNGINVTILKESQDISFPDFSNKLFFIYGFGGHFGFYNDYSNQSSNIQFFNEFRYRVAHPKIGLDVIVGLEYRFIKYPFTVGLESKPFFELFGKDFYNSKYADISISLKYIID